MKIELVNPAQKLLNKFGQYSPPYGLAYIGTLLKERSIEVEIIDEAVGDKPKYKCNFAIITSTTSTIKRAYSISMSYLNKGIPTIIGGVHVSSIVNTHFKDELKGVSTSIIIGPIENIIDQLINDMNSFSLKKCYVGTPVCELKSPDPIWNENKYFTYPIQSSVGCPFNCDFCAVNMVYGGLRMKNNDLVLSEIQKASKTIIFLDDNLYASPNTSKILFGRVKEEIGYKPWGGLCSLNVYKDEKLLKLFSETGCTCINIGFETLDPKKLDSVKKRNRAEEYANCVKTLHDHGILVYTGFISFPDDDEATLKNLSEFLNYTEADLFHYDVLTPFPGTPLFEKLEKNMEILDYDWSNYDFNHAVIKHKIWTTEEWEQNVENFYKENIPSQDSIPLKLSQNMSFTNPSLSLEIWQKLASYLMGTF